MIVWLRQTLQLLSQQTIGKRTSDAVHKPLSCWSAVAFVGWLYRQHMHGCTIATGSFKEASCMYEQWLQGNHLGRNFVVTNCTNTHTTRVLGSSRHICIDNRQADYNPQTCTRFSHIQSRPGGWCSDACMHNTCPEQEPLSEVVCALQRHLLLSYAMPGRKARRNASRTMLPFKHVNAHMYTSASAVWAVPRPP
jgi:hypothetical protein